jgi:uncharacterized membrane protein HdeD (DUF308 family)
MTLAILPGVSVVLAVAAVGLTLCIRPFVPLVKLHSERPWNCNLCMSFWGSLAATIVLSVGFCLGLTPFTVSGAAASVLLVIVAGAAAIPLATTILRILAAEKIGEAGKQ